MKKRRLEKCPKCLVTRQVFNLQPGKLCQKCNRKDTPWNWRDVSCSSCGKAERIRNPRPGGKCKSCASRATGKSKAGAKWTAAHRATMEKWRKENPQPKGPDNPQWKGGSSHAGSEYNTWRRAVYKRDNWQCQLCKTKASKLHAHHIEVYALFPEKRLDIGNGITLCDKCHYSTHSKSRKCVGCGTKNTDILLACLGCDEKRDLLVQNI